MTRNGTRESGLPRAVTTDEGLRHAWARPSREREAAFERRSVNRLLGEPLEPLERELVRTDDPNGAMSWELRTARSELQRDPG